MSSLPDAHLLVVDPSIGRTGALLCARSMALALTGLARCELVTPAGAQAPAEDLAPFQAVYHLPLRNPGRSTSSVLLWMWTLVCSSIQLRLLLRRRRITHLVLNDWYLLQGILCRLLGYRGRILTWVRLDPWRFGRLPAAILFRLIAASSDRILVVSRYVQRRLPSGVVSTLLYDSLPQPALPALPSSGQRIIYVGNYTPGKGQDLAIEAFALIADRHPQAQLHFHGGTLGRSGNDRWLSKLQERALDLGLAGRIHFHGFAADPRLLLQGALVALNLSQGESFSLTVLEACAAGIAVIATDCGGPAEIIEHRISGMIVPLNPQSETIRITAQTLDELLNNPAFVEKLSRAAQKRISCKFSAISYRERLVEALNPV
jgi:glycosyltransferase involved in cell wall biosynthesis